MAGGKQPIPIRPHVTACDLLRESMRLPAKRSQPALNSPLLRCLAANVSTYKNKMQTALSWKTYIILL